VRGMLKEQRSRRIIEMLRERPEISVAELAQAFDSSQATIRRDLRVLDMNGLLRRTYGGALSSEQVLFEPTVQERAGVELTAKRAMGRYAVDHLIKDGNVVLLDAGSSIGELVRELSRSRMNLTIITNSIPHASVLGRMPTVRLYMLGGEFRVATDACTGSWAEQMLATIRADIAFLGVNGIDLKDGLTTPTIEDAHVKRAMISAARKTVVLADHTKFGRAAFAFVAAIDAVDCVVTDDATPFDVRDAMQALGVEVVGCEPAEADA
jgi:DeoR family transcriptional regulator, fructose operon transcriptional repressor